MNYQNPITTIHEAECMQKKNFLDHLEVNRKLAAAYSGQRIEGILRRMYDDLRCCEPQLLMFAPFLNSLNLELFPKDLIDVVEYNASLAELDKNSVLLATLGSIASAMCGCYVVQVDDGWKEAGCLYAVSAAPSGFRKSVLMKNLGKPFNHHFEELNIEFEDQSAAYEEIQGHLALLRKKIITGFVNSHVKESFESGIYSGNPKEALADLQRLVDDLGRDANLAKPRFSSSPQIFSSTGSKISIGANMSRQGEYTCIHEAEGGFFEGEVAFKSGHPDLFLKAYDMESYDYKSNNVGNITMRRPAICINAFVQPDVLQKWYQNTKLQGRGMIQRFLVLFAFKPIDIHHNMCLPTPTKSGSMLAYNSKISEMLKRNFTQDKNREIRTVTVTPDAYAYIKAIEKGFKQNIDSGRYLHMQSFLSKAHGSVVRLALCIHAWNNPTPEECPITQEEMFAAASLMDVIVEHASRAFAPEQAQKYTDASEILKWIYRCDWTERRGFTDVEVRTAISGLTKKQCHVALDLLERHNYIRQYHEAGRDRLCVLNPRLAEKNYHSQNALPVYF